MRHGALAKLTNALRWQDMERNEVALKAFKESVDFLTECEAKFWVNYIRKKGYTVWSEHRRRLEKRRGKDGLERLLIEMRRFGGEV